MFSRFKNKSITIIISKQICSSVWNSHAIPALQTEIIG